MLLTVSATLFAAATGLTPATLPARAPSGCSRAAQPVMMPGVAALEKKGKILTEIKEDMDGKALMFCVSSQGLQVNAINDLRQTLPEGVVMRCAKNTLINRAVEDYPQFQADDLGSLLHSSNYWFFVSEDSMRPAVKGWNDWIKDNKKEDDNAIKGGVFGGEFLDAKGVEAVSKLPTKQELMGQTASLVKALPTKLARLLKQAGAQRLARGVKEAQGSKLARAVKAASEKMP